MNEPDNYECFEAGVFDTRAEAEQCADEYYPDKHVEFIPRGTRTVLYVYE